MKKLLKFLLIAIPLVLIVIVLIGYTQRNQIIKTGVETMGPKILGAPVTLEKVSLRPLSGIGELNGFVIGNPEGFKTPSAVELDRINVKVDMASLRTDTVRIKAIEIEGPRITVEGLKGENLKKIQENAGAYGGTADEESESELVEEESEDAAPARKVVIEKLTIADGKLNYAPVLGKSIPIALPRIELTGIGESEGGMALKDVIVLVFGSLDDAIVGAVKGVGAVVGDLAGGGVEAMGAAATEGGKAVDAVAGETAKAIGSVADETTKAIGSVADAGKSLLGSVPGLGGGEGDEAVDESTEE